MPFSQSSQLSAILGYAEALQPVSVLDLGTGMGQYGFMLRNNLEFLNLFEIDAGGGRLRSREQWRITIDGVEGCAAYMTPVHHYAYNKITIANVLDALPGIADNSYELVIGIDILEHFSTSDGLVFLAHCKRIASRAALVSTPKIFYPQEIEANPYENHRSLWTQAQLAEEGFGQVLANAESWVAIHTAQ